MFYDCRNDVDALWNLHRVFPMNIWDLQLQELCYRRVQSEQTRLLNGLAKALTEHLGNMSADWKSHKEQGRKLFHQSSVDPTKLRSTAARSEGTGVQRCRC